jgi:hypothetical protein
MNRSTTTITAVGAVIANETAVTLTQPQISVNFVLGSVVDTSNSPAGHVSSTPSGTGA